MKVLDEELGGLGIGSWTKPNGGYFISFDAMDGCAKTIAAKCKEAGVTLTGAGATSLIRRIPKIPISESHLPSRHRKRWQWQRICSYCVKMVSVDKLLENK